MSQTLKVKYNGVWKDINQIFVNSSGTWTPLLPSFPTQLQWSISSGDIIVPRPYGSACGVPNQQMLTGGYTPSTTNGCTNVELYNGVQWYNQQYMLQYRWYHVTVGGQMDQFQISGRWAPISATEQYNSTIWESRQSVPLIVDAYYTDQVGTMAGAGVGDSSNQIWFGGKIYYVHCGYSNVATTIVNSYKYNGSTWSQISNKLVANAFGSQQGTVDNCLSIGGAYSNTTTNYTPVRDQVENYNGTVWCIHSYLPITTAAHQSGGKDSDSVVIFGGSNTPGLQGGTYINTSIAYDIKYGTQWYISQNLNINRQVHGGCGSNSEYQMQISGINNSSQYLYSNEVLTSTGTWVNNGIVQRQWQTGQNNIYNQWGLGSVGKFNDQIQICGCQCNTTGCPASGNTNDITKYNGTVWINGPTYLINCMYLSQFGESTHSLVSCGGWNGSNYVTNAYIFNNVTWRTTTGMLQTIGTHGSFGIEKNGLIFGNQTNSQTCFQFNNEVWSSQQNMNFTSFGGKGCGVQSSGIATKSLQVEQYNGCVWYTINNMNNNRYQSGVVGNSYSQISTGGLDSVEYLDTTEEYNGNIWIQSYNLLNRRMGHGQSGNQQGQLIYNGAYASVMYSSTEYLQ